MDDDCLRELRWLYDRRDLAEARRDLAAWLAKWQPTYPKLCGWVEEHIEQTLAAPRRPPRPSLGARQAFYRLPRQHHEHLKSTDEIDKRFVSAGAMVSLHGRPRGKERGRGWEPRRAA
jgi:putative transposase